jgi:hypothetical protein
MRLSFPFPDDVRELVTMARLWFLGDGGLSPEFDRIGDPLAQLWQIVFMPRDCEERQPEQVELDLMQ